MKIQTINFNIDQNKTQKQRTFSGYNVTTSLLKGEKENVFFDELIKDSKKFIEKLGKKYNVDLKFIHEINPNKGEYEQKVQLKLCGKNENVSNNVFSVEKNLFGLMWLRSFGEDNITIKPWLEEQEINYLFSLEKQKAKPEPITGYINLFKRKINLFKKKDV